MSAFTLADVNSFSEKEFIEIFCNIVEHYKNCAIYLKDKRPYRNVEELINSAKTFLEDLNEQEQESVINSHPDLAGKIYQLNSLTDESQKEQKSAGLDKITLQESEELNALNIQYKEKFRFPFVICAKENKFASILNGLKQRMANSRHEEIKIAIEEVKKIMAYRILEIIKN